MEEAGDLGLHRRKGATFYRNRIISRCPVMDKSRTRAEVTIWNLPGIWQYIFCKTATTTNSTVIQSSDSASVTCKRHSCILLCSCHCERHGPGSGPGQEKEMKTCLIGCIWHRKGQLESGKERENLSMWRSARRISGTTFSGQVEGSWTLYKTFKDASVLLPSPAFLKIHSKWSISLLKWAWEWEWEEGEYTSAVSKKNKKN